MTKQEFRNSKEYDYCVNKIRNYHKGFEFTIPFYKMNKGQKNAMHVVLDDCKKEGLIESIGIDYSMEDLLTLESTAETWKRL